MPLIIAILYMVGLLYASRLKSLSTGLFVQWIVQANDKDHIKAMYYRSFVMGIHRWPLDLLTKGQ